jgi:hypothetical protein
MKYQYFEETGIWDAIFAEENAAEEAFEREQGR